MPTKLARPVVISGVAPAYGIFFSFSQPPALSLPLPPKQESLPLPPSNLSLPVPPSSMSLPPPPFSVSLPPSPQIRSLPPSPLTLSLPPKLMITSAPLVPSNLSAVGSFPTIVGGLPKQLRPLGQFRSEPISRRLIPL